MNRTIALMLAVSLASPAVASAQARFQIEKSGDNVVRLDTETGEMTLCAEKDGTLACRMGADERRAFEDELQRLEKRVEALEGRLATGSGAITAPSEAEIDRTIGIMERFMRSFFGLARELSGEKQDQPPLPERS